MKLVVLCLSSVALVSSLGVLSTGDRLVNVPGVYDDNVYFPGQVNDISSTLPIAKYTPPPSSWPYQYPTPQYRYPLPEYPYAQYPSLSYPQVQPYPPAVYPYVHGVYPVAPEESVYSYPAPSPQWIPAGHEGLVIPASAVPSPYPKYYSNKDSLQLLDVNHQEQVQK